MSATLATQILRQSVRRFATTPTVQAAKADIPEGYFQLRKLQERFQVKDGKLVHIKGGMVDQVLYRFTMGLSLLGVGGIVKLIWDLSFPTK